MGDTGLCEHENGLDDGATVAMSFCGAVESVAPAWH